MAIYGIGANYDGVGSVLEEFQTKGLACIGWLPEEAPTLHKILEQIDIGDIIFIKSYPPSDGLIIKLVGITIDDQILEDNSLGRGIKVKWVWEGKEELGKIDDKYNVRMNTIYQEHNSMILKRVIELLLSKI